MKNIFMDLYYNFDGCIPKDFDHQAYLADILNKEEEEKHEASKKEDIK